MSASLAPVPVSTAGAWTGLAIAVRGALSLAASLGAWYAVGAVTLVANEFDKVLRNQPGGVDAGADGAQLVELFAELAATIRPSAIALGVSGAAIGLALFIAGGLLLRGSESGRRAARGLLIADALHTVTAAVVSVALIVTELAQWSLRFKEAIEAFPDSRGRAQFPQFEGTPTTYAALQVILCLASLALLVSLHWLAGRPSVRQWCSSRSRR